MDNALKLIDNKTLCLYDSNGNLLATHKPRWTFFIEFKQIGHDCIIVNESHQAFKDNSGFANIYCLNNILQII